MQSVQPGSNPALFGALIEPKTNTKDTKQATALKPNTGLIANGPAIFLETIGADSVVPKLETVRTDPIANQTGPSTVRLFGLTGGDPAINGLLTYIGFSSDFESMNFAIGDILDYKVLVMQPGRIDLEISESAMDANENMSTQKRRVILEWSINDDAETPVIVTLKPAA